MTIQGKFTEAVVYASIIEQEAIDQIRRMCDHDFTQGSQIRIMPDVHTGTGCTIGTTMTVLGKAVPNVVGVDIGCGMYTVQLAEREIDFARLDEAAHFVPSGMNVWGEPQEDFELNGLRCFQRLRDVNRLKCSLGTLGGGNHFIEVDRAMDGTLYLVIHTGSRNLGVQVAHFYQNLAIELHQGREEYENKRKALIEQYKAEGRQSELQSALDAFEFQKKPLIIPEDLCYLYGKHLDDYLHDVEIAQRFARRSRELIAQTLLSHSGLTAVDAFHTIHNYIDTSEMILRKGAIAAHKGEKVLIPINMRDGSILAVGKGNHEWNCSAPHGAGRLMSRTAAKEKLKMETYQQEMQGIYTTSVNADTLDEAPMAYKSLEDIISVIGDTVEILDVMKPVYNFKASCER